MRGIRFALVGVLVLAAGIAATAAADNPSPPDPLHAEPPDYGPESLSHHIESAGHPGHGLLPGQVNPHQGVDREGGDEPSRAEALGEEQNHRYLLGDAVKIAHRSHSILSTWGSPGKGDALR